MSNFVESFIKKWESHYGCQHRGLVELNEGQNLVYYDNRFVEDTLKYAGKLYLKTLEYKKNAEEILSELKAGSKNQSLSGLAAKVAGVAGEEPGVVSDSTAKKTKDKEESPGNGPAAKSSDVSAGGSTASQGPAVQDNAAEEKRDTPADQVRNEQGPSPFQSWGEDILRRQAGRKLQSQERG